MPEALPLDKEQLNEHSKTFAHALFSAYPSWRRYAAMAASRGGQAMELIVTVPPPEASRAEYPLTIDTDRGEVTVAFDKYHSHFEWPSFDEVHGNPLRFIEDIVEERVAVVSWWAGERWARSTALDVPAGEAALDQGPAGSTLKKIRSWNGTYSRDETLFPPGSS